MTAHSALGASSAKRWMNCPSSPRIIAAADRSPSSPYAAEGSTAHWAAEQVLLGHNFPIGQICPETELTVTEDMIGPVMDYVYYCKDLAAHNPYKVEERVSLAFIHTSMFGTNDFSVYDPIRKHLDVVDLKYGAGVPVEAIENPQGIYYAIGAAQGLEVETVTIHIHQPRAYHPDGPVRTFTLTIGKLRRWVQIFRDAAFATEDPAAPCKTGDWCGWCDGKLICPEHVKRTLELARMVIDMEPLEKPTPEQLAERMTLLLEADKLIKGHKSSADVAALRMSNNAGQSVPGFKLVNKRADRKWVNEKEVIATAELFGLDPYAPAKLKTPAQLEKTLGSVDKSVINHLSSKPDNGKTLVPLSDKRAAVVSDLHERYSHLNNLGQ